MKKINKKAQLKIQQMVFMLVALTLLFILVALFFIVFKVTKLQKDVVELRRDQAAGLVSKIASTPEFIFEDTPNAIDADKLMILQGKPQYREYFGNIEGIIIQKIYPSGSLVECTRSNYPECNQIKLFTQSSSAPDSSYVAWCRKQSIAGVAFNKCDIALLMIKTNETFGTKT